MKCDRPSSWLALMIGNSRLHWGIFAEATLQTAWDTPHLEPQAIAHLIDQKFDLQAIAQVMPLASKRIQLYRSPDLWIASVVPQQAQFWQPYSKAHWLTLEQISLQGLYLTVGIDRALALVGAIALWSVPMLVIDAGTALTLSGVDGDGHFVGGAILPGLQLQMRSLSQHTAALPSVTTDFTTLPPHWATNTADAIRSGVLYGVLSSIQDFGKRWLHQFPTSAIALTGGDSALLHQTLQVQTANWSDRLKVDPNLVLRGIAAVRQQDPYDYTR